MIKLNLPEFDYKVKQAEGKVWIFDLIRKKYVVLTPEEWVRQHWIHFLITSKKYPKSLITVETGLRYNKLAKRSDLVVFNRQGQEWMLIECKSPKEELGDSTIQQASVYNTTLKAPYVVLSNGIKSVCYFVDYANNTTAILEELPAYEK